MNDVTVIITADERRLITRIARRVYSQYCPAGESGQVMLEDLEHYGAIGLIEAKGNYKDDMGVPWIKFAAYRVRGAMMDALRKAPIIRFPQAKQQKIKQLKTLKAEWEKAGKSLDSEKLAAELGWTMEELRWVEGLSASLVSIEDDQRREREATNPFAVVLSDDNPNPEDTMLQNELAAVIEKCMKTLTAQLRIVLQGRLLQELKLKDLARTCSCSIERIRQLQNRAQEQMRDCLSQHGWSLKT